MRPIDADELRDDMNVYILPITKNNLMGAADVFFRVLHLLENAHTVYVNPSHHGIWIPKLVDYTLAMMGYEPEEDDFIYQCSLCENEEEEKTPYCPSCGAKMDLEISDMEEYDDN